MSIDEYNSHFNFFEYGFSSMKDMAYKLPSIFHVKLTEDGNQLILFKARVRTELENKLNGLYDPSLFYTNIPKVILENLSQFFNKNRTGVRLDKMMTLYRSKYGRSYEPLNYGYSSEKHMFECLNKMVKIKNDVLYTVDPFAYTKLLKTINPIDTFEKNALTLPNNSVFPKEYVMAHWYTVAMAWLEHNYFPDIWKLSSFTPILKSGDASLVSNYRPISILSHIAKLFKSIDNDFLLDYTSHDICNGRFKYYTIKLNDLELINVIVAEIYNPSSFYIQLSREIDILNSFMDDLQEFYNENEEKYKVLPTLILPELTCTSYTKGTNLWHRAKVLKIVDEENVQLFFVDYGSIAIIPKLNIRLLQSKFSSYPAQAVYCGLYKCTEYNYSREISESFADMVEHQVLQAQVHPSIPEDDSKTLLTLFLNTKYDQININKRISKVASVQQLSKHK
ncbi:tudor domain-containing protein 5-like [Aphis craccivora]|uniref:Tudor domain-containing protein 5-like n=1 Tax=Aphis craccivora TaxID=307492 RepID=A0A6G0YI11_APHCR|nr:tudor domain-containing protein 5-like [Aphis craccivora]